LDILRGGPRYSGIGGGVSAKKSTCRFINENTVEGIGRMHGHGWGGRKKVKRKGTEDKG
jgi:hypothetical protein